MNADFNNHYIRRAILRIWNKFKLSFYQKIPCWVSSQEAMHRRDFTMTHKWLTYNDLLELSQGEYKLKSRENLLEEGYVCQWFSYTQIKQRFKIEEKNGGFEQAESEFGIALCTNDEHVIAKLYKLLLKYETEDEQVKDCMIKWAQNVGHNILMEEWENM